jgi:hypothetical protein
MRACMVLRMEKERGVENEREDKEKRKEED